METVKRLYCDCSFDEKASYTILRINIIILVLI